MTRFQMPIEISDDHVLVSPRHGSTDRTRTDVNNELDGLNCLPDTRLGFAGVSFLHVLPKVLPGEARRIRSERSPMHRAYLVRSQNGQAKVDRFSPSFAFCRALAWESDKCFSNLAGRVAVVDGDLLGKQLSEWTRSSARVNSAAQCGHELLKLCN